MHDRWHAQRKAIGLLLLATVLWSVSGAVFKVLFQETELTAAAMAGYRSLFAGVSLLPFAAWNGGLRLSRLQPIGWLVVAALAFCGMMWTFVASVGQTTSANAIILMYTAPLWVLLAAPWVTGDHAQRRDLQAAMVGMAGMLVILLGPMVIGQQSRTELSGMLLGLASGVCFATVSLALRKLSRADAFAVTCVNNLLTAAVLLVLAGTQGSLQLDWRSTAALLGLGTLQCATPYALYCYCLRFLTPQRATLVLLLEPILNPTWVWLVVGEAPSWATVAGGALIISGLVIILRGETPQEAGEPAVSSGEAQDVTMRPALEPSKAA